MYSLRGMPHLTPDTILKVFDITPDKYDKWICHETAIPTSISFEDTAVETSIEPLKINIEWFGKNYWLFPDGGRIYSINEDYIKPILDESDYLTYHKRETTSGAFVLACKVGFELKAIVAPAMLHSKEEYAKEIEQIAGLYAEMARENVINSAYEIYGKPDSPPPEVDEETGEVIEGQSEFMQETL